MKHIYLFEKFNENNKPSFINLITFFKNKFINPNIIKEYIETSILEIYNKYNIKLNLYYIKYGFDTNNGIHFFSKKTSMLFNQDLDYDELKYQSNSQHQQSNIRYAYDNYKKYNKDGFKYYPVYSPVLYLTENYDNFLKFKNDIENIININLSTIGKIKFEYEKSSSHNYKLMNNIHSIIEGEEINVIIIPN